MNLTEVERTAFALRGLYRQYGYAQYKMNKFEEYDLYARNKDFLVSQNILTFTDLGGRLMALKPDVTLSIVRSTKDAADYVEKVYYNENVYRVAAGSDGFREILQMGLECIGDVDTYCIGEAVQLAAKSLRCISERCVLQLSHLGVLSAAIDALGVMPETRAALLRCVGGKNLHELTALCREAGAPEQKTAVLRSLAAMCGTPETVLPQLRSMLPGSTAVEELEAVVEALGADSAIVRIDFSVVNSMHYYNGIVFRGFVAGIPDSVISGGQYDRLMQKMGRRARAIGFAVYLDLLELLPHEKREFDIDALLLYDQDASPVSVREAARSLRENGLCVMAQRCVPEKIRSRQIWRLEESGVRLLENHA